MSIPGLGSGGTSAANFANATSTVNAADNSQANATAQTLSGNQFNVAEGANFAYNGSDYGATQAASLANQGAIELAEFGIQGISKTQAGLSDDLFSTEQKALNLAGQAQEGQGGTLIHGLVWIVGLLAGGLALYSIARISGTERRASNA